MALGPGGGFLEDEMLELRVEGRAGILEEAWSVGVGKHPGKEGTASAKVPRWEGARQPNRENKLFDRLPEKLGARTPDSMASPPRVVFLITLSIVFFIFEMGEQHPLHGLVGGSHETVC